MNYATENKIEKLIEEFSSYKFENGKMVKTVNGKVVDNSSVASTNIKTPSGSITDTKINTPEGHKEFVAADPHKYGVNNHSELHEKILDKINSNNSVNEDALNSLFGS
jgi:hypothetical protein